MSDCRAARCRHVVGGRSVSRAVHHQQAYDVTARWFSVAYRPRRPTGWYWYWWCVWAVCGWTSVTVPGAAEVVPWRRHQLDSLAGNRQLFRAADASGRCVACVGCVRPGLVLRSRRSAVDHTSARPQSRHRWQRFVYDGSVTIPVLRSCLHC